MDAVKIIFIGPKGVGKTTIRKIFFEQADPIKLLNNALEPTYGVETNIYDVGKKIAIHDLAGQQLDEWLTYSSDVFIDADLIISVFDCREEKEPIREIIEKISEIRNSYCPKAYYGVLFHKKDLIDMKKQENMTKFIDNHVNNIPKTSGFATSISENFFMNTFKDIIFIIKESLLNIQNINISNFLSNYILLSQFIDKNQQSLRDIFNIIGTSSKSIDESLLQMQNEGFLTIDNSKKYVTLSNKGVKVLNDLKIKFSSNINNIDLFKKKFLKALLISDEYGRAFLEFEIKKGFFKDMLAKNEKNTDTQIISMFFSAIKDFGKNLDKTGVKYMFLMGEKLQCALIAYQNLNGIFFLEDVQLDTQLFKMLTLFMQDFTSEFAEEINQFFNLSSINNIDAIKEKLENEVNNLNELMEILIKDKQVIPKDELLLIYKQLEQENIDNQTIKKMKKIIFQYIITEDPTLIKEITTIMEKKPS